MLGKYRVLALAALVRLHNAGHVCKPAWISIHDACTRKHAPMRILPGAAATSTPSEQGAVALKTDPATRPLAFLAVTARPCRFTDRACRCCTCRGGWMHASRCTFRPVRLTVSSLALLAAIFCHCAATAMQRRSSTAARTSVAAGRVAAGRGGLRADAGCLLLDARAQDSGLQSLSSLLAFRKRRTHHREAVFKCELATCQPTACQACPRRQ